MKEATPLKWPEGWVRTLPEHQRTRTQWKKPQSFYIDSLEKELGRMGTVSSVLTINPRGDRDPGVAVWFSRTKKDDFSWRETLQMAIAYPTLADIDDAYRRLAKIYHPEGSNPDINIFHKLADAKAKARYWVSRQEGNTFDYAIACDSFRETRLNVAALANSIRHIRGLEQCGTSAIMEKTFQGFAQISEKAESHVTTAAS